MQGRAFGVTIRPSTSDSIILEVPWGMRMVRRVKGTARRRDGRWMVARWGESLGSSTMDYDGSGWRFIGDSQDVRTQNQVGGTTKQARNRFSRSACSFCSSLAREKSEKCRSFHALNLPSSPSPFLSFAITSFFSFLPLFSKRIKIEFIISPIGEPTSN